MQFNSIPFLFYFLPLFLAAYYLAPEKWRMGILSFGSLLFYWAASGYRWWSLGVFAALAALAFFAGRFLEEKPERRWLLISVAALTGVLVFFKLYAGGACLPVGMSFYIFQMLAYLIDVYRRRLSAERDPVVFAAQAAMFPKLLSGPLMDPAELQSQTKGPTVGLEKFHSGLQLLILGLGLKVLLANRLGGVWGQAAVVGYESISTPFAWLALVTYSMRLYFDFYGYSLMAVGLGRMLGFELPMNFLEPYSAGSVSEFYRRWHATLGRWFREYIYIPLGGNRQGTGRTILNLAVVWALTGLWHGVNAGYVLWAMFLCLLIVNERLWLRKYLDRTKVLRHVYTVLVILLSWVPFALGDFGSIGVFLGRLFHVGAGLGDGRDYVIWFREYVWLMLAGVVFATPLPKKLWRKVREHALTDAALFILFWAVVYFIATSAQDPFMYFDF